MSDGKFWQFQTYVKWSSGAGSKPFDERGIMMIYQIYVLDELGNALSLDLADCATEYEAKERAAAMVDEQPVELWCGDQRIARLEQSQD